MKKFSGKFTIIGLLAAVSCGIVGSITGTFAWYGYSTRATASLSGTTINTTANIQVGIYDKEELEIVGLSKTADENNIYWQKGFGGLRIDSISDYLSKKGYGGNSMRPVSSGNYYVPGSETVRKDVEPIEMVTYQTNTGNAASKEDYFVLPLAFRVARSTKNQDEVEYLKGTKIYLSDIEVDLELEDEQTSDLDKAFRIDFKEDRKDLDEGEQIYTLLAPGREDDGSTALAGLLDGNIDGFADVVEIDYPYKPRHELVYGTLKENSSVTYSETLTESYDEIPEDYNYPIHLELENHKSSINVYKVESYEAFIQNYFGTKSLLCDFSSGDRLINTNNVKEIATTSSVDGITYLTLTSWIEGWDENVNLKALGIPFHLNLQFQIDRID